MTGVMAPATGDVLLHVTRINATRGYRFDDERIPLEDTVLSGASRGELYRHGLAEYGRCTGKVYVDTRSRGTIHTGYVFAKRERYTDCDDTYLAETWITVEEVQEPAHPVVVKSIDLGGRS